MNRPIKSLIAGAVASSPLLTSAIPFGVICGASCVEAGISEWGALGMSGIMFAGVSQLVTTQLLAQDASLWVIIITGVMINMRMFMYSASLSVHFEDEPVLKRIGLAYFLTDQAYATSIKGYEEGIEINKPIYYLGAGMLMWTGFFFSTAVGAYFGNIIPSGWELDFIVPLTFIALLVPAIKNWFMLYSALAAAGVALLAHAFPCNMGLLLGAITGIFLGYSLERRRDGQ